MKETVIQKFWERVDPKEPDECWEWKGSVMSDGYGRMGIKGGKAHRLSWEIHFGEIPHGMFVCHRCDNRSCVNPNHLFLGSAYDNQHDKFLKGRTAKGERHGRAKLIQNDIIGIRFAYDLGITKMEIAKNMKMSFSQIKRIVDNESWSWM